MNKSGKKRPLKECLGENSISNELRHKRRRFDNILLLRDGDGSQNSEELIERRYYNDNEVGGNLSQPPRRILRAGGKRKQPVGTEEDPILPVNKPAEKASDENDIINELTKEFKKARLRPVFFTISSFIEQTVDEVGFTMADEPETEITVRLALPKKKEEIDESLTACVSIQTMGKETVSTSEDQNSKEVINSNLIVQEFRVHDSVDDAPVVPQNTTCSATILANCSAKGGIGYDMNKSNVIL